MIYPKIGKSTGTKSRLMVTKGLGEGGMVRDYLLRRGLPFGILKIFWNQRLWLYNIMNKHFKMLNLQFVNFTSTKNSF